jgi:hypothetical protein
MRELVEIQNKLRVDKSLKNEFSGWAYRNIESILAKLKPLLDEYENVTITLSDEVKQIADHCYVESTATISNGTETISTTAQAGINFLKKGTDVSQQFGSASTYARRYAICGLLLVSAGESDPDSLDNTKENQEASEDELVKHEEVLSQYDRNDPERVSYWNTLSAVVKDQLKRRAKSSKK